MATEVQVGQRVRINERYDDVLKGEHGEIEHGNRVGTEFTVTAITYSSNPPEGHESHQVITGDPNGWGMWGDFVDVIPSKAGIATIVRTALGWPNGNRTVRISSGERGLSLSINRNPAGHDNIGGTTVLTLEQAEEIAHDLLARVAEMIRGAQ